MILVSVSVYHLATELGFENAQAELARQLKRPDNESLPCVRAIHRLRTIDDLTLRVDAGGTHLGKVRSRHAHAALELGEKLNAWISVDEDVEASVETMQALVTEAKALEPTVVIAPCFLRRDGLDPYVNVAGLGAIDVPRDGYVLRTVRQGGFGLVGVSRRALELVAEVSEKYLDDDGVERRATFRDTLEGGYWWGEDISFFRRLPQAVNLYALAQGHTSHAGDVLDLSRMGAERMMKLPPGEELAPATPPEETAVAGDAKLTPEAQALLEQALDAATGTSQPGT